MKKIYSLFFLLSLLLTGCAGFHNGLTRNYNGNTTEVILSERNFRVVSNLQGTSEALYIFGIGGMSQSAMIAEAKAQILQQADMIGKSRALVNEIIEEHHSYYLIVSKKKVTVTAQLIEFTNVSTKR
jgi:PBP1b-binding outer membrane lipoprotein LpoB